MSNRIRPREFQRYGGKLTRPREDWRGHRRGARFSPVAGDMQRESAGVMEVVLTAFGNQMRTMTGSFPHGLRMGVRGNANRRSG